MSTKGGLMGVSWYHEVHFICSEDESEYYNSLPSHLPGVPCIPDPPVYDKSYDDKVVSFSSGGYNIFDLFDSEFPKPESWVGIVHRISPCQGQEFDVVDWVSRDEYDEKYDDIMGEDEGYNPMNEYTDPSSDYWMEGNPHLIILDDDETQREDIQKGITYFKKDL